MTLKCTICSLERFRVLHTTYSCSLYHMMIPAPGFTSGHYQSETATYHVRGCIICPQEAISINVTFQRDVSRDIIIWRCQLHASIPECVLCTTQSKYMLRGYIREDDPVHSARTWRHTAVVDRINAYTICHSSPRRYRLVSRSSGDIVAEMSFWVLFAFVPGGLRSI